MGRCGIPGLENKPGFVLQNNTLIFHDSGDCLLYRLYLLGNEESPADA